MRPDAPTLDPQLEEVLGDIARDPQARHFMVDPRRLVAGLRSIGGQVSIARAGLRPAERELLRVHREEVAWLLVEEARRLRRTDRTSLTIDTRPLGADDSAASQLKRILENFPDGAVSSAERTALAVLLGSATDVRQMRMSYLALAVAFRDQPSTRVEIALELMDRNSTRSAHAALTSVLAAKPEARVRSSATQALGTALHVLGRPDEARETYRLVARSSTSGDDSPLRRTLGLGNLLVSEVEAESVLGVVEADRMLLDMGAVDRQALLALGDRVSQARGGGFRLSRAACDVARACLDRVSDESRVLLNALLE